MLQKYHCTDIKPSLNNHKTKNTDQKEIKKIVTKKKTLVLPLHI